MAQHALKQCPRCNTCFECKTGSIQLCQCQAITLTEQQLDYIHDHYDDCLCITCLEQLKQLYIARQHE